MVKRTMVRVMKRPAIKKRSIRNVNGIWRRPNKPAIICEMVSVAEPAPPPTKENTGMIELMPRPSRMLDTTASTTMRMTCGVYAPYAFLYRRTKCITPLALKELPQTGHIGLRHHGHELFERYL